MPTQNKIIKDGKVCVDEWQLLSEDSAAVKEVADKSILPLSTFLKLSDSLSSTTHLGVWINNDIDINEVAEKIIHLPLIAIQFPGFMDGRGFSLARLLRDRFNYTGEIRAVGHVIRDQLCYLNRCGFNAFVLDDNINLDKALESLSDFKEAYQTSVDKPSPLFRRRMN